MKKSSMKSVKTLITAASIVGLVSVAGPASAHGMMGPGMMGPGMMGPGMMGPGMMGPGMMGPGMMGPGMMGDYGPWAILNLNEEQQQKITQIRDEIRKKHWDLMDKMNAQYAKLRDLYYSDKRDPAAIGQQQQHIFDLQRQMMESSIEAQNRMAAVLTPEQKQQFRGYGGGRMVPSR